MASFTENEIDQHALDWEILRDGGICIYWRPELLDADLVWFRSRKYEIKDFDSGSWHSESFMHDDLSSGLAFPAYYGRNLDALNDCVSYDLVVPDTGGVVLCFRRFDQFAAHFTSARVVLNILARASRTHMLRGRRLVVLVHSDDAQINFVGLGAVNAAWNRHEWLRSNRGL